MKKLLILLILLPSFAFAQEKILSFDNPKGNTKVGHLDVGDSGVLIWAHNYPIRTSAEEFRAVKVHLALVRKGKVIWRKEISKNDKHTQFNGKLAVSPDMKHIYMIFEDWFYKRKENYTANIVQISGGKMTSTIIEHEPEAKLQYITFCDENNLYMLYNSYNLHHNEMYNIRNWNPRMIRFNHQSRTSTLVQLNLPLDEDRLASTWDFIGTDGNKMLFTSKRIDYKSGAVEDRIVSLDENGAEIDRQIIKVDFKNEIFGGEIWDLNKINHGISDQYQPNHISIEIADFRKVDARGASFDDYIGLRSFYSKHQNRIFYLAMERKKLMPDLHLIITDYDSKVISDEHKFKTLKVDYRDNYNNLTIMHLDDSANYFFHDIDKQVFKVTKDGVLNSRSSELHQFKSPQIDLPHIFYQNAVYKAIYEDETINVEGIFRYDSQYVSLKCIKGSEAYVGCLNEETEQYEVYWFESIYN